MEFLRDENGIAHIVGLSGGKDSTCLALALKEREPRPYNYVYTPTGDELPELEQHLALLETMLGQPILRISNGTLKSQSEAQGMLPSQRARWCTRLLKIKPFGQLVAELQPVVCYIGLRGDEETREGTRPGGDSAPIGSDVRQDFPFQRWGWGLVEILEFLAVRNIVIPQRTDCARCPYQTLGEWYNLYTNYPEIYADAEQQEADTGHTFRSPTANLGPWPHDLKSLREEFEKGRIPVRSLNMMEKRKNMCRACSL